VYVAILIADVADSYIKISACLTQLATADNSNLDKYKSISHSGLILSHSGLWHHLFDNSFF